MEHRPFVADADPAFVALRADIRDNLRTTEDAFRAALRECLLDVIPPELAAAMPSAAVDLPARFLRGLLPFFAGFSEMLDAAELLSAEVTRARQSIN
jgi:hypothetical protein